MLLYTIYISAILCPKFSKILINTYQYLVRLVICGNGEIYSTEGTTQGDSLAITPLIRKLHLLHSESKQVWYADDMPLVPLHECQLLQRWWDTIKLEGPKYFHSTCSSKTYLVVKPDLINACRYLFCRDILYQEVINI